MLSVWDTLWYTGVSVNNHFTKKITPCDSSATFPFLWPAERFYGYSERLATFLILQQRMFCGIPCRSKQRWVRVQWVLEVQTRLPVPLCNMPVAFRAFTTCLRHRKSSWSPLSGSAATCISMESAAGISESSVKNWLIEAVSHLIAKTAEVKLPAAGRGTVFFLIMTEIHIRSSRVKKGVTFSQMSCPDDQRRRSGSIIWHCNRNNKFRPEILTVTQALSLLPEEDMEKENMVRLSRKCREKNGKRKNKN